MQLLLLHLDDALESQPDFMRACLMAHAHEIHASDDGPAIRLWSKEQDFSAFAGRLARQMPLTRQGARLCFIGSGDFHHATPLLVETALQDEQKPVTIIHFDNHPDWVRFVGGIHCGSWVNRAAQHAQVDKVITIGACSKDLQRPELKGANLSLLSTGALELYPYDHAPSRVRKDYGCGSCHTQAPGRIEWKTIASFGEDNFIAHLLSRIKTESVYLTIDKDVFVRDDAVTNWDQGSMRLPYLLSMIAAVGDTHRIIGADVIGDYSRPVYAGNPWTVFAKRAEVLLDQPLCSPDPGSAMRINSEVNHKLLAALSQVME
jgi:hypothetical protein